MTGPTGAGATGLTGAQGVTGATGPGEVPFVDNQTQVSVNVPLTVPTTVLTDGAITTTEADDDLIINTMCDDSVTTDAVTLTPSYNITLTLLRDVTPIATVTETKSFEFTTGAARTFSDVPNIIWFDDVGAGTFVYSIQVTVTGTGLASAAAETRSIVVSIF